MGSKVVQGLTEHGHDAVAAAPSTGVNTVTGDGLSEVLQGASAVIDVSNSPTLDGAAKEFFDTATTNLLEAEAEAGVTHHVALSVAGTDRLAQESEYFQAKQLQEKLISAGPIPYTIVHATQFFEFLGTIADSATVDGTVRLPNAFMQPMASADVAEAVSIAAVSDPVIHYSDGNNRDDIKSRFVVTMICVPGQPMLTLVDEKELAARRHSAGARAETV